MNTNLAHGQTLTSTQLYEHYPVEFVPFWRTYPFYIFVAVVVLVCLAAIGRILWRWFKRFRIKPLLPGEYALQELEGLRNSVALGASIKDAYYALTSIMKRYLQHRYGVQLEEKTDTEMTSWVASASMLTADIKAQLTDFFAHAYDVKFTDGYEHDNFDEQITKLRQIIEQTRQTPSHQGT